MTRKYNFVKVKPAEFSILDTKGMLFQKKYDGASAEVFIENGNVSIIGRGVTKGKGSDFTNKFPEIVSVLESCVNDDVDFLSEIIVINKSTGIEECGLAVGRTHRIDEIDKYAKMCPARLVVHDVVSIGNKSCVRSPYQDRLNAFRDSVDIENVDGLDIIVNYTDGRAEWKKVVDNNLEGVVIRDPNAELGVGVWKLKKEQTEDVYCKGEYEMSDSNTYSNMRYKGVDGRMKTGVFKNLVCYQIDRNGREINVCDVGGGISHDIRANIMSMIDSGKVNVNNPLVMEIKAYARYENGKLRHPSFVRIREDKPWKECIWFSK